MKTGFLPTMPWRYQGLARRFLVGNLMPGRKGGTGEEGAHQTAFLVEFMEEQDFQKEAHAQTCT